MGNVERMRLEGWSEDVVSCVAALEADGYVMTLVRRRHQISGEIVPGVGACRECLVPETVLRTIIASACGVDPAQVELHYPASAGSQPVAQVVTLDSIDCPSARDPRIQRLERPRPEDRSSSA